MKWEDKELLLKDLSARLPYKVVAQVTYKDSEGWKTEDRKVLGVYTDGQVYVDCVYTNIENTKPYLRPMSSMTEEEKRHISKMMCLRTYDNGVVYDMTYPVYTPYYVMEDCLSYLRSIHVDYSGLIEKGLAIEAQEEMYNLNK